MEAKFVCFLEIIGVGFRANIDMQEPRTLNLRLGFSHDIKVQIPQDVRVFCLKPTLICCTGVNLARVTQFSAKLKLLKQPEVYKGKGIRYRFEKINQKQGKKK